jgi:hypothetical protein
MWEKSLIESRGTAEGKNKKWTVPISMAIHGLIIAIIVAASYWFVEAVQAFRFGNLALAPPPPPPPPLLPEEKQEAEEIKLEPTEQVQPQKFLKNCLPGRTAK